MAGSRTASARHPAERACAGAGPSALGEFVALLPRSRQPTPHGKRERVGLTLFCTPAPRPPAPAEPLFPFLHSQPPPTPPLAQRVPGRSSRNRTISTPTFSTRDAQPCLQVFLKQRLLVAWGGGRGARGRAGARLGTGRDPAWRARRVRAAAPAPPWPAPVGGRRGATLALALEGCGEDGRGRRWPGEAPGCSRGVWSWLLTPPRRRVGVGRGERGWAARAGFAGASAAPSACHLGSVLGEKILGEGNDCFRGGVGEELGSVRSVASRKRKGATLFSVG